MKPVYEGNPKHKAPWQPGRKGSLCPSNISLERARQLLHSSILDGRRRYGADQGRAFCAQQHDAAKDRWHGYPIGWRDVPAAVRRHLIKAAVVSPRDIKRFWEDIQ